MKTRKILILTVGIAALASLASAKIITVTTTENISPAPGQTNLVQAINLLADGDTIKFDIPGDGPFYLVTPPITPNNGYPVITNNNVTIDGYSQPGASPNTDPILSSNNAVIKIVLDSRAGGATIHPIDGAYGDGESGVLFVLGTNVTIRGLCFLGPGVGSGDSSDPNRYAISFGSGADYGHVSGCRIGLDLDNKTVYRFADGVTGFQDSSGTPVNGTVVGVAAGPDDPAAARAQFNIILGEYIPIIIEGANQRIAGNFLNVYPDGLHDYNVNSDNDSDTHSIEAFIELGKSSDNLILGTDGDGNNDADERNIFGGLTQAGDGQIVEWYGGTRTNMVIAGNYFGMAVDGHTQFTNSMKVFGGFNSTTTVRVGSDFDGVSDAVEGNVIAMNYPFATIFPSPGGAVPPDFASIDPGARVSMRGNVLINNNVAPYTYDTGQGNRLDSLTNYFAPYIDTTLTNGIFPVLSTNSTQEHLMGYCGLGLAPYTNIIIDVYVADPEGWTNGEAFFLYELMDPITFDFYGFPQGRTYIASFLDNGPLDRDPRPGFFDFDLSSYNLGSAFLTVTANYSADPPGTHNGQVQTSEFAVPVTATYIPGGIESVGLKRITPDTPIIVPPAAALGNWEPYTSVIGDSVFLIEGNTFATNDLANQRFIVYFQPADGSTGRLGDSFFADNGTPFRDQINLSRQNGNPGRVAGDKRPGATTFLTAAETSAGQLAAFQSDSRYTNQPVNPAFSWTNNPIYGVGDSTARYATEQAFSLNLTNLTQTPLTPAFDAVYGDYVTNALPSNLQQVSRTGGTIAGLDNGNFAVVIHDQSGYLSGNGSATSAAIITPTGTVVKGPWLVDPNDIWDNVAAYKGGFAVRVHNMMYFYGDDGTLMGSVDVVASSGVSFSTDRGDATRIAAHINSPYVYLCGSPGNQQIWLAVFDSRTQSFVTASEVSEPSFVATTGRAAVASDALDRITCVWESQPAGYGATQVAARVLKFDATSKTISPLTHSFWVFMNTSPTGNILSHTMNVSMTTKQICVAAKGDINLQDDPSAGTNSPVDIDFFTVFSHPAPADDPTTPIGGQEPDLTITLNGNQATLSWPTNDVGFTLESANSLTNSSWKAVGTADPTTVPVGTGSKFYRLRK